MTKRPRNLRRLRLALPGMLLVATGTTPVLAQEAATDAAAEQTVLIRNEGSVSAEAQAVLDRMTESLMRLKDYSVSAVVTRDEQLPYGYKLQNNESARMWVQLPDKLRVEVEGDIKNRTYVYDGKQLTIFAPDVNAYATTPAPATVRDLITPLIDAGVEMPLIDLLYHGASGDLTAGVRVGILVGETKLDGVAVDHLAFRQADVDWQLWVDKGANALPRKIVITTRYEVGDPQYQATLRWDASPPGDAKRFTFAPPAGSNKITFQNSFFETGEGK